MAPRSVNQCKASRGVEWCEAFRWAGMTPEICTTLHMLSENVALAVCFLTLSLPSTRRITFSDVALPSAPSHNMPPQQEEQQEGGGRHGVSTPHPLLCIQRDADQSLVLSKRHTKYRHFLAGPVRPQAVHQRRLQLRLRNGDQWHVHHRFRAERQQCQDPPFR